jgi:hypothetical protein
MCFGWSGRTSWRCLYFVPGGRIFKNVTIADAFRRLIKGETGLAGDFDGARPRRGPVALTFGSRT